MRAPQNPSEASRPLGSQEDPRQELAALTVGLRKLLDRERADGRSRAKAAQPAAPRGPSQQVAGAPIAGELEALRLSVASCNACALSQGRARTVFGAGPPTARVMFVGAAPGAEEEASGLPFGGAAGQLLTRIIEAGMGLSRSAVYVANTVKCRPPDDREPLPGEQAACRAFLEQQIERVDPEVIVALGGQATHLLLGTDLPIHALRGQVHSLGRRFVVPTLHPAELLVRPELKPQCWEDIQRAMALLGLPQASAQRPPATPKGPETGLER